MIRHFPKSLFWKLKKKKTNHFLKSFWIRSPLCHENGFLCLHQKHISTMKVSVLVLTRTYYWTSQCWTHQISIKLLTSMTTHSLLNSLILWLFLNSGVTYIKCTNFQSMTGYMCTHLCLCDPDQDTEHSHPSRKSPIPLPSQYWSNQIAVMALYFSHPTLFSLHQS